MPPSGWGALTPAELGALQRRARRRGMLAALGASLVVGGLNVPAQLVGGVLWVPTAIWVTGLAVVSIAALGPWAGAGCLAQVLGLALLGSFVCSATASSHPRTPVLATALGGAVLLSWLGRRRRRSIAAGSASRFEHDLRGPPGSTIDVAAREVDPGDHGSSRVQK